MKKGKPITAFYVETLLLIVVFIGILLALTQVFGLARNESVRAKLLTNAVTLAQNGADAFMATGEEGALLALLDEGGNVQPLSGPYGVVANYRADMTPCFDRNYRLQVHISWTEADGLLQGFVLVYDSGRDEVIYTLPIARYVGEVSP